MGLGMNKNQFKIGDRVHISATASLKYDDANNKKVVYRKVDHDGIVIGAVYRMLGEGKGGGWSSSPSYSEEEEYSTPYLEVKGTVLLWRVAVGYLNTPLEVPVESIQLLYAGTIKCKDYQDIPWKWTNPSPWSDKSRQRLSKESGDFPRDEKGRWC